MAVFTSLSKQLRGMRDLPLRVNAVAGVHPALRYTEVNAPRADERGQAEGAFLQTFTFLVRVAVGWSCRGHAWRAGGGDVR
jgi:hypothetical protein